MADRYTYLPSIGFFVALVFLLNDFAARLQAPKIIAAGVAAVILDRLHLAYRISASNSGATAKPCSAAPSP